MKKIDMENIDSAMVHIATSENDETIISADEYPELVDFILNGFEIDFERDAARLTQKIQYSDDDELLADIKSIILERIVHLQKKKDIELCNLYDRLLTLVNDKISTLQDSILPDDPQQQIDVKRYEVDITLLKTIYEYCQRMNMFKIDEREFIDRMEKADLSGKIYNDGHKTRLKILVKMLGRLGVISEGLYSDVIDSLGISKSDCTKPVQYKFEGDLEAIIDEWRKAKNEYQKEVKRAIKRLNPT